MNNYNQTGSLIECQVNINNTGKRGEYVRKTAMWFPLTFDLGNVALIEPTRETIVDTVTQETGEADIEVGQFCCVSFLNGQYLLINIEYGPMINLWKAYLKPKPVYIDPRNPVL